MALFGLGKKEEVKKQPSAKMTAVSSSKASGKTSGAKTAVAVLKRPLVTEKAISLESNGQYVFKVTTRATKPEIKKGVEKLFNVKVEKVNIINHKAKANMFRGKVGYQSGFKKAMVKLQSGQKIEVIPH